MTSTPVPISTVMFTHVQRPDEGAEALAARYHASIEMAEYADRQGFTMLTMGEHHGTDSNWNPSPVLTAAAMATRCPRIGFYLGAILAPLHDPIRLAEDLAILDVLSHGRATTVAAVGYRPEEYAAHRKSWDERGRLMDEAVETMLKAWTGEPFEYHGTTVRVTPRPYTRPNPTLLLGGASRPAARRAARFGLPFSMTKNVPEVIDYYHQQCEQFGTEPMCTPPPDDMHYLLIAEDPDKAWAELGEHLLWDAQMFAEWHPVAALTSSSGTVDQLRDEGKYRILTPDECIQRAKSNDFTSFFMHPLAGGIPIDQGWQTLSLYAEKVLPAFKSA